MGEKRLTRMRKPIEEVKFEKTKGLENVTFTPPRFGTYTLACMMLGLCFSLSLWYGIVTFLLGLFGILYSYSKRGEL